jgi:signal transduction histidine kinase
LKRRLFKISNWTKLDKTIEQKNNVMLSLFSILGMFTAGLQIIIDLFSENYFATAMDAVILITVIATYTLNEKRKHLLAKLLFVGLLNVILFVYGNVVPKSVGVYLYFFPVIAIAALIFDSKTRIIRGAFMAIPILIVALFEISNYQFFGNINIQAGIDDPYSFPINLFVSLTILAVSIYQMMLINREIDNKRYAITYELKEKNEDLQKSNTELDHFVYSTSHDLKAPLSSISGLINIAKHEVKEDKALEYFRMIEGRIDKLNLFIKDIIDISRNSRLDSIKEAVNIASLVDIAIDNNKYMENAHAINFIRNIDKENNHQLDRARLEVILNNLISNAIKYHKTSGERWIQISVKKLKTSVRIIIADNGIGIKEDRQDKVFDMFYRGHESSDGSGLGLYIVMEVIKKMKGKVLLKSEEHVGTEIKITLPIA